MLFLASLIYIGIHPENHLEDYWNTFKLAPIHAIIRFFSQPLANALPVFCYIQP
jgi:hypothetical protein